MLQAGSLKSLALKVLREGADSVAHKESCPTEIISKEASGTGQSVGHSAGQVLTVQARIRGRDAVTETAQADVCWHCNGEKVCRCALCAIAGPNTIWQRKMCRACLGTGFLAWPETVQGI